MADRKVSLFFALTCLFLQINQPNPVHMLSKSQIKFINSLKLNKFRKIHQAFLAEGEKLVGDFLTNGLQAQLICACPEWIQKHALRVQNTQLVSITPAELRKISALSHPNQVLAVFKIPKHEFQAAQIFDQLSLVLDDIRDPGNLGTIIRTADWFGIRHLVCSNTSVDAFNPKVVQATMGSIARVQVAYTALPEFLSQAPAGTPIYGTFMEGENIHHAELSEKGVIIIGNEGQGISSALHPFINHKLNIPAFNAGDNSQLGSAESLNASIANAIVCYEFRKKLRNLSY